MAEIDGNTWMLFVVAVLTGINTYYSRKTEKNTNSMKDALVSGAEAKGRSDMREEMRSEMKDGRS